MKRRFIGIGEWENMKRKKRFNGIEQKEIGRGREGLEE